MNKPDALVPVVVNPERQLATQPVAALTKFEPSNLGELMQYAEFIAGSALVPKAYRGNPGSIVIAVQMGETVGLKCGQALQNIAVIGGRATIWGDAVLALCLAAPGCIDIIEDDIATIKENQAATCIAKRRNRPDKTCTFSVEDAKKAGLWGKDGPWQTNPNRMLQMRARGFACRDQFPDALRGLSMREEVADIPVAEKQPLRVMLPEAKQAEDPETEQKKHRRTSELQANQLSKRVAAATTPEELQKIGEEAFALQLAEPDKDRVRADYKKKVQELKASAIKHN
ncbi:hypothetical protein CMI37_24915 [Candidatus Pacearchaeota archaeon]|nr:hypothetical protein [Candidatus Pacearchaeota archaeon]|tara:strand:+ start:119 stop:973 length:855 start_codon:yes stop_codon:yes gene_type:complete